ncbi:hypothetical protein [Domibacillus aminovorans]|uniref:hypothetical protein n=1 Tax=Domibacillus aminovorans TaxID=29332 RepID=UPI0009EF45B3
MPGCYSPFSGDVQKHPSTYIEPSTTLYKEYLGDWFITKKNSSGIQTAKVYQNYLQSRIMPRLGNYTLSKLSTIQISIVY